MLDVTQAPYNCRFDWTGDDSTATDNYEGLQNAINDASTLTSPGIDRGGSIGDAIFLPSGTGLVSKKLVLPFGVYMKGVNCYSTVLKMSDDFAIYDHFIDVGDATTHMAAMNCGLSDMILYSRNTDANNNKAMVFTNNAQDTYPIVGRCRIYAGNRAAIWGEIGYGGASIINFCNINCHNNGSLNGIVSPPIIYLNYGSGTMISIDGCEPAGPQGAGTNQIGLFLGGGNFDIRRLHAEQVWTGAMVDVANDGHAHFEHCTGGNLTNQLITINNRPSQAGKISVKNVYKNGSVYTVLNGLPGGVSITSDILAERIF